jgi:hypothetical protein
VAVDRANGARTNSRTRNLAAALACAAAIIAAVPATALSDGATQQVTGVVQPQFGVSLASDGQVSANASTIGVSVTRTTEDGVTVVTVAPRY